MIIIIKKDGQIVTDDGNPIEGKALEGAYMLLADAQDGDSIVYDSTNHMWKAGQGGGSFAPDITDPQDGDTLVYNAAQQKWVNGAGSSGGAGLVVHGISMMTGKGTLDKTWQEIYNAASAGNSVVLVDEQEYEDETYYLAISLYSVSSSPNGYAVIFGDWDLYCEAPNGYPTNDSGGGGGI